MRIVIADPPSYTRPYDHGLASALARRGHDVHLVASPFRYGTAPEPDAYRLHEPFLSLSNRLLQSRPRSRLRYVLNAVEYIPATGRLVRLIEKLEPDVVHLQWLVRPRFDVRWVRRLAKPRPLVFTAHDLAAPRTAPRPVWRDILACAARVVVHSHRGVAQIEALGVERERIVRIAHPAFEAPSQNDGAPAHGRTLLFFGLLRAYKGLDVLVRALPSIPGARLVVAGDPVDPVEPARALAGELGVADRIDWRLGFLPEAEVDMLMRDAALVVLPYRRLDSSGVLATALGRGRPAVVSDVGSLGELVSEFGAGRVVEAGDAAALAAACTALLDDDEALRRASEGARAAARALTWDAAAAEHERMYEELVP